MTPRQEALRIIADVGADFLDNDVYGNAWAPAGLMWHATGCHSLTVSFGSNRAEGWRAFRSDLRKGVEVCDQSECETCAEGKTDD